MSDSSAGSLSRVVLFHRDFRAFTGGHLKVWNYFNHVSSAPGYTAQIFFTPESKWDLTNPWFRSQNALATTWQPEKADILFLAGMDWRAVPAAERNKSTRPIINFIQHPRHAEPRSELRSFLKHRAIRICVSQEVADAIQATGEVNGPVFTIPNGIDLSLFPASKPWAERSTELLICGLKAPELARLAYTRFAGSNRVVRWLIEWIPRKDYLTRMADAKITLFLPRRSEGFYLPPLEGMACGTVVVCPDCVGNRSFCIDRLNCFRPEHEAEKIFNDVKGALGQSAESREQMLVEAERTVQAHSLEGEREAFVEILGRIEELWPG
jgi:glycosyltransferase involved in cell wall biosynthesis